MCEDCNIFETCGIISEIQKLRYEILRFRNNVQTNLFQNVEELKERNEEEQMELRNRRLGLRRKQFNCLRRRRFLHYHGYPCFKRKVPKEENRDMQHRNQNQILDSYF